MKEIRAETPGQEVPLTSLRQKVMLTREKKEKEATVDHPNEENHLKGTNQDQNRGHFRSSDRQPQEGRGRAVQEDLLGVWRGQAYLIKATKTTTIIDS